MITENTIKTAFGGSVPSNVTVRRTREGDIVARVIRPNGGSITGRVVTDEDLRCLLMWSGQ